MSAVLLAIMHHSTNPKKSEASGCTGAGGRQKGTLLRKTGIIKYMKRD